MLCLHSRRAEDALPPCRDVFFILALLALPGQAPGRFLSRVRRGEFFRAAQLFLDAAAGPWYTIKNCRRSR